MHADVDTENQMLGESTERVESGVRETRALFDGTRSEPDALGS
jgi:hypothetical protein